MDHEQSSQIMWGNSIYCWDEYSLLEELAHNDQNYVKARWEG